VGFTITCAVSKQYDDLGYPIASAVSLCKHDLTGCAQSHGYVCVSTIDDDVANGRQQRVTISICVEVEDDFNATAELHQSNLGQILIDGKRSCDSFGEAEHFHVPVVIIRISDNDTCRLVKDQNYVRRSWTRYVGYYNTQIFQKFTTTNKKLSYRRETARQLHT